MEVIFFFLGIGLGSAIVWIALKNKASAQIASVEERSRLYIAENNQLKKDIEFKNNEIVRLSSSLSAKSTKYILLQERLDVHNEEISNLRKQFNVEFKNLANEILEEKTKKFAEQNKSNLGEILNPLNQKLKEFEKKVEDTYDKEAQQRFSLKEEVKRLAELNQQISKEANLLTRALKGESKTQGNWGEVILENILERSGLRKGEEYTVQESFTQESGKRFQPDVVVHYPGERSIVIDSKVSLTAYERMVSEENEELKAAELKAHLTSIKKHINELSEKRYEELEGIKTLDFTVMFLPVEPAYLTAIQSDPALWGYAYAKRILLISPTNLIAILKMIDSLWKQEYQSRNVLEIARQGGNLYDAFVNLNERLIKLGKKIDETSNLHRETIKSLSEGRGNLISRVENLKALGIKTKKQMPDNLLGRASEDS